MATPLGLWLLVICADCGSSALVGGHDGAPDSSASDDVASDTSGGDAAGELPPDGGAPGKPADFTAGCPESGCPAGTVCVAEEGGIAGGGGAYCAPIPFECHGTPTCACMAACACRSGVGLRPEACTDGAGTLTCDNGIR